MTINVTNISPVPGSTIARGGTLRFDVTFSPAVQREHAIYLMLDGVAELVWDGEGFLVPYASSSRQSISAGYRYTIRRTGSWPAVPVINVRQLGTDTAIEADFSSFLVFSGHRRTTAVVNAEGNIVIGIDADGPHEEGATWQIFYEADTVDNASKVRFADDFDPNDNFDDLDPTQDYEWTLLYTQGQIVGMGRNLGLRDTAAPTIASVQVDGADPDALLVNLNKASQSKNATGLSLVFNVGTARTISGNATGQGTSQLKFPLSGPVADGDDIDFVIASTRTIQSMNGAKVAAATHNVTLTGYVYDYDTIPGLTFHFDPALDQDSGGDGNPIGSWASQVGAMTWTASTTARPTYVADKGGIPAAYFNGTANVLTTTSTIADMFNATTGYFAALVWIEAIDGAATNGTAYLNVGILSDATGYMGLFIKTVPEVRGYIFDGSIESGNANVAITTGAWHLVTLRWEGGNMYVGVDGVESSAEALDAGITTLTDVLRLGRGPGSGLLFQGWIGRHLGCDTVPDAPTRAAVEASMMAEAGI